MSRPDLFRAGNTTSARFDNVRPQDIPVVNGMVKPGTGGMSTFTMKQSVWADNKTWVVKKSSSLGNNLTAKNDHGDHWLIAPSSQMTIETYKSALSSLNRIAIPTASSHAVLAKQSAHMDRATRFVFNALASVVHDRLPVASWDENDYAYVAELAKELEDGTLPLSQLVWKEGGVAGEGWSREGVFVASAVSASMEATSLRVAGNDDDEADAANDHAYLREVLKLEQPGNLFVAANQTSAE
ncbi:hypothetical protein R3P38DRAFT_3589683 [Favolaschia claudopus]|uniref:Tse2 ADP-ribosyltransferase toxin domain-containing protein n=1 Tax=Favolaschia claudopus TaxID=2862362 RepID=A0AAW0AH39_9AGAR